MYVLVVLCALLCSIQLQSLVVNGERTLQLVNLIYRHGDRTPVYIYPTDPHKADAWPQGLGQLTNLGMNMHYNLGKWLHQRYIETEFLNQTYSKDSLHVRSTDVDRTLMSAAADLSGFYPPQGRQIWKEGFNWMPIPIHTVPVKEDYLLELRGPPCPVYDELEAKTKDNSEYKALEAKYKHFFANLTINTGFEKPVDLTNIFQIEDPLFEERQHNLSWPDWAQVPGFYKTLKMLSDSGMYFLFNSKEKSKLKGGLLVGEVTKNMVNKSTTKDPVFLKKKVFMYSAHDTSLAAFLSALGIYNGIQPPLASCIGIEMWKEDIGKNTVEIWFRNDSTRDPYPLKLTNCSAACPLDDFIKLTKDMVPGDIRTECGVSSPSGINNISIIILVSIVIGLLVLTMVVLLGLVICHCRRNRNKDGHIRLPTDDTTA